MNYQPHVNRLLKKIDDPKRKQEILELFNYVSKDFANDLALNTRDYELGLIEENERHLLLRKCYNKENQLREILGFEPLPEIDLSII